MELYSCSISCLASLNQHVRFNCVTVWSCSFFDCSTFITVNLFSCGGHFVVSSLGLAIASSALNILVPLSVDISTHLCWVYTQKLYCWILTSNVITESSSFSTILPTFGIVSPLNLRHSGGI